jgi:hypothetical protein
MHAQYTNPQTSTPVYLLPNLERHQKNSDAFRTTSSTFYGTSAPLPSLPLHNSLLKIKNGQNTPSYNWPSGGLYPEAPSPLLAAAAATPLLSSPGAAASPRSLLAGCNASPAPFALALALRPLPPRRTRQPAAERGSRLRWGWCCLLAFHQDLTHTNTRNTGT